MKPSKNLLTIIFISLGLNFVLSQARFSKGDKVNLLSPSGFSIQNGPEIGGTELSFVPYGSQLLVEKLNRKPIPDILGGYSGHWMKVTYKGWKGWIFDAYCSRFPAPDLAEKFSTLADYAKAKLSMEGPARQLEIPHSPESEQLGSYSEIVFTEGVELRDFGDEESINQDLIFENASVEEVALIAGNFNPILPFLIFDLDFVDKEVDGEMVKYIELPHPDSMVDFYSLTLKCNDAGKIHWLEVYLDTGIPSSALVRITKLSDDRINLHFEYASH